MTGLVRRATLLAVGVLLLAGAAYAGLPSSGNSDWPTHINLMGRTNPADPLGNVTYVIRDGNNNVVPNADVVLDFSTCSDIILADQASQDANVTVNCALGQVIGSTDEFGSLTIAVVGASNGNGAPRATNSCVEVFVGGNPFPNISVATADRDGANGVGAGDLGLIIFDFINNPNAGRSDLDGSGTVGAGDLSQLQSIFIAGGSALSGTPCP